MIDHSSKHDPTNMSRDRHANPSRRARPVLLLSAFVLAGVALIAAFTAFGDETPAYASPAAPSSAVAAVPLAPPSPLKVDRELHRFGDVPIGGGIVQTTFTITNESADPTRLVAVYTSCMCTTATLVFPDGATEGPFGMPGHDLPVTLDRELAASEAIAVTVRFDPAAHGPDAVGPVERVVNFHTADGGSASITLTANVVRG